MADACGAGFLGSEIGVDVACAFGGLGPGKGYAGVSHICPIDAGSRGLCRAREVAFRCATAESNDRRDGSARRVWGVGFRGDDRADVARVPSAESSASVRRRWGTGNCIRRVR